MNRLVIETQVTDNKDIAGYPIVDFQAKSYEKCVIEELAKVKAELEKLEYDDFDCNLALPAWKVYDIIDKHISELKGE